MTKIKFVLILLVPAFILIRCSSSKTSNSKELEKIDADDVNIKYLGRIDNSNPKSVKFAYPGIAIKARFEGTTCNIRLKNKSGGHDKENKPYTNYYNILIDNKSPEVIVADNNQEIYKLKKLSEGTHTITIFKRTEAFLGEGIFEGFELNKGKKLLPLEDEKKLKIEFIGNSITCGYGNEGKSKDEPFTSSTENNYLAYGAVTARKLNADYVAVAYSGKGMYKNFDGTTKESMSLIYDRIFPDDKSSKWDFKKWQPDAVVINLGTNDFAKSHPDSLIFVNTYVNFLKRIRIYYPNAYIFCIEGPMTNEKNATLTQVKNYINASKAVLEKTGDKKIFSFFPTPQSESDCGSDFHPNTSRHAKMAEELTVFIKNKTGW